MLRITLSGLGLHFIISPTNLNYSVDMNATSFSVFRTKINSEYWSQEGIQNGNIHQMSCFQMFGIPIIFVNQIAQSLKTGLYQSCFCRPSKSNCIVLETWPLPFMFYPSIFRVFFMLLVLVEYIFIDHLLLPIFQSSITHNNYNFFRFLHGHGDRIDRLYAYGKYILLHIVTYCNISDNLALLKSGNHAQIKQAQIIYLKKSLHYAVAIQICIISITYFH